MKIKFSKIVNIALWLIIAYLFLQRCVLNGHQGDIELSQFVVEDLTGQQVDWSSFDGKPVFLNLWASWCGPCRAEMPSIKSIYKTYGDEVAFIIANTDGQRDVQRYLSQQEEDEQDDLPLYILTESNGVEIKSIPYTIIFDAQGQAKIVHKGFNVWNSPIARRQINKLVKQAEKN